MKRVFVIFILTTILFTTSSLASVDKEIIYVEMGEINDPLENYFTVYAVYDNGFKTGILAEGDTKEKMVILPYEPIFSDSDECSIHVYDRSSKTFFMIMPFYDHLVEEKNFKKFTLDLNGGTDFCSFLFNERDLDVNVYWLGSKFYFDRNDSWGTNNKAYGFISFDYISYGYARDLMFAVNSNMPDDYTVVGVTQTNIYYVKSMEKVRVHGVDYASGPLYSMRLDFKAKEFDMYFIDEKKVTDSGYNYQIENDKIYYQDIKTNDFICKTQNLNINNLGQLTVVSEENIFFTNNQWTYVYDLNGNYIGGFQCEGTVVDYLSYETLSANYVPLIQLHNYIGDELEISYLSIEKIKGLIENVDEPKKNAAADNIVDVKPGSIYIEINGIELKIPSDMGEPYINDSRTMIPLRAITEALGATVSWEAETSSIILESDDLSVIKLRVDSCEINIDGVVNEMDVPCKLNSDSRTYVPLRFVSQALVKTVTYENRGYHYILIE